ncbi:MAG TPA: selenocysteine-specific translation elongation factor [Myxococcales bacterium]|nr:selenocysteine-specific translation elongation factor [Myxococcales bacterium]
MIAKAAPEAGSAVPLRVVVGTAGHVDHGKTSLVHALTGIDTDRLPEEKRRGITLEAGYAHLALPGIGVAGVVDVPGHERFLRAMVAAAGGIDVAVLCIAADEGPMPQTAEHLDVLRLLGVRAGVIALTKADLLPELGAEHRELVMLEIKELVAGTFLEEAGVLPVSSRTGQGLPELLAALSAAVRAHSASPRAESGPLFLPLDRAFALKGFGTVVTGTLFSGALGVGDAVDVVGAGARARDVRVRGVQVHGLSVERARAGQRTAANLAALELAQAPRGAALVAAGTSGRTGPVRVLDVELELLPVAPRPLKDRTRLLAHLGTAQAQAVVALLDRTELLPGERALAQLRLGEEVAALAGLRFLLRGELGKPTEAEGARIAQALLARGPETVPRRVAAARAHASTLGGGRVLSVGARRRRRGRTADIAALEALAGEDALAQAEQLTLEAGLAGASPALLAARGSFTHKTAERALERLAQSNRALLFDRDARLYAHVELLQKLQARMLAQMARQAEATPMDPSLSREELRQRAGDAPPRLFAKAIAALQDAGELRADAERVRPARGAVPLSGPDADAQSRLAGLLDQARLAPPRVDELPALLGEPAARVGQLLKALAAAGRASRVSEELWFAAGALAELKVRLVAQLGTAGEIDAQGFKELTGQSRKFTIPLAEYFDRERVTLRIGDKRVLRKEREK